MKKNKITLSFICLLLSNLALAEYIECFSFNPLPGKHAQMLSKMAEAAEIHEEYGALVNIAVLNVGGLGHQTDYCLRWDNRVEWAKSKDAMRQSEKLTSWTKKALKYPSATQVASIAGLNIDPSVTVERFRELHVYHVFVIKPAIGREAEALARMQKFEEFYEKFSTNEVEIYNDAVGGTGEIHVLSTNESWTAMVGTGTPTQEAQDWYAKEMGPPDPTLFQVVKEFNGHTIR